MNKTIVTGNVGAEDGVLGTTGTGTPVLNFNFATNEIYKDREGQKKTDTTWYKVAIYGTTATNLAPYIVSGKKLLIVGRVKAHAWKTDGGEAKADLVLKVIEVELLGDGGGGKQHEDSGEVGAVEDREGLFLNEEEQS